jgi:hypothetical protein
MVLSAAAVAAVRSGDVRALRDALDLGEDVNGHEDNEHTRNTLLNIAMLEKDEEWMYEDYDAYRESVADVPLDAQLQVIRLLLERGADPNRGNKDGERPLHIVASDHSERKWGMGSRTLTHRAEKIIDLLVAAGAQIDVRTNTGATPLMYRVGELSDGRESRSSYDGIGGKPKTGSVETIRVLLKHGADWRLTAGSHNTTALDDAEETLTYYDDLEHGSGYRIAENVWRCHYSHIIDLLEAVDRAGSWKNYMRAVREPCVKLWTMRYLCLAGRAHAPPKLLRLFGRMAPKPVAGAAAARTRSKRLASSAAQTTPPDEVFKHILGFWDPSFFLPARSAPIGGWW